MRLPRPSQQFRPLSRKPCVWGLAALVIVALWDLITNALPSAKQSSAAACARRSCAVLPAPPSALLARAPSTTLDRWPQMIQEVSILQEPVERPLDRYLHKRDGHYNRIVPDWTLQYKTAQQQYLYEGEFAVFVREVTEDGLIVQDVVTGVAGFARKPEDYEPFVGTLLRGARCTHMDITVVTSPDVEGLRMQTGVVFEWDERAGHGYILPTEEQEAWRMLRVFRRDIVWHGSRRLYVGQFVQFETARPGEVPVEENDEPLASFALRVRSPEVLYSLEDSYQEVENGGGNFESEPELEPDSLAETSEGVQSVEDYVPPEVSLTALEGIRANSPALAVRNSWLPAESGRPEPRFQSPRAHPLLNRWASSSPAGRAESPAWLWDPPMQYIGEEEEAPTMPLQLRKMQRRDKPIRILTHEVARERGDLWREPAQRLGTKLFDKTKPPGRGALEKMALRMKEKRDREYQEERRRWKLRAAALMSSKVPAYQEDS